MSEKIKFIHASDFRLGLPVFSFSEHGTASAGREAGGASEKNPGGEIPAGNLFSAVPEDMFGHLYRAAQEAVIRVFDAAIRLRVDFLLLTGNIFSWKESGPAGMFFLAEQFRRLEKEGIFVYWAPFSDSENMPETDDSPAASDFWEDVVPLPENIFRFTPGEIGWKQFFPKKPEGFRMDVPGMPPEAVTLLYIPAGMAEKAGTFSDFSHDFPSRRRIIALAEGMISGSVIQKIPADYWALGGQEARQTLFYTEKNPPASASRPKESSFLRTRKKAVSTVLHFPGSPQGHSPAVFSERNASEEPRFGCSLVEMNLGGEEPPTIQFLATERIGWKLFSLEIPEKTVTAAEITAWMKEILAEWRKSISRELAGVMIFWNLKSRHPIHEAFLRQIYLENRFPFFEAGEEWSVVSGQWSVENAQNSSRRPRTERLSERILETLQEKISDQEPFLWHVSVNAEAEHLIPPEWRRQRTAVGDFLHLAGLHRERLSENASSPPGNEPGTEIDFAAAGFSPHSLELLSALSEVQLADELRILADISSAGAMREYLREAETLGADILAKNLAKKEKGELG